MQSTITGNVENQVATAAYKKTSEQDQKPLVPAAGLQTVKAIKLPEDIVDLSASSQSSESKKPSTPVSMAEKELLLNNSSDKPDFSIHA